MLAVQYDERCSGCRACESICPNKAITMKNNLESFSYPEIDLSKCVDCGLCKQVCPIYFHDFINPDQADAYVGINIDREVLFQSSSGGAFGALCNIFISQGYLVYGVCFDKDLKVIYNSARTIEECIKFSKSKYVLSDTNGCFEEIAENVKRGRRILFTGTSCHCAALWQYLKIKQISMDQVFIVNILCHGGPSQGIFDSYIKEMGAIEYQFRYKENENSNDLNSRNARIRFSNGNTAIRNVDNDEFLKGYYKRLFYRNSCYQCNFARRERFADVTIGDAWGLENYLPQANPKEGISLMIFNTTKGKAIIDQIKQLMIIKKIDRDLAFNSQSIFNSPTMSHPNREKFFVLWRKRGFSNAVRATTKPTAVEVFRVLKKNGFAKTISKVKRRLIK